MHIYSLLHRSFSQYGDKDKAQQMSKYMRNQFHFYGVTAPLRHAIYKNFLREEGKIAKIDYTLLNRCWQNRYREFQYFVVDYLKTKKKYLTFADIPCLKKYVQTKQWWDTIDGLDRIIGSIAFVDKRINDLMLEWSLDKDLWMRRVAIDHQLDRKNKTNTTLLAQILKNNFNSSQFFINKAIGWSLREYSKTNPSWVKNFINKYKNKMSTLSIREASKYPN